MIGLYAFDKCNGLKAIHIENGCEAPLCQARVPKDTVVVPFPAVLIGNESVCSLRNLKQVTIPDGAEKIGNYWFWGCGIE